MIGNVGDMKLREAVTLRNTNSNQTIITKLDCNKEVVELILTHIQKKMACTMTLDTKRDMIRFLIYNSKKPMLTLVSIFCAMQQTEFENGNWNKIGKLLREYAKKNQLEEHFYSIEFHSWIQSILCSNSWITDIFDKYDQAIFKKVFQTQYHFLFFNSVNLYKIEKDIATVQASDEGSKQDIEKRLNNYLDTLKNNHYKIDDKDAEAAQTKMLALSLSFENISLKNQRNIQKSILNAIVNKDNTENSHSSVAIQNEVVEGTASKVKSKQGGWDCV